MALQLKGFLYGHYDSRGGTVFVEANTREQADKKYVDAMFGGFVGACTPAEEDFICEGVLTTEAEPGNMCDLESDGEPRVFVGGPGASGDEEDYFDGSFADLVEAAECPEGCYHPRWDDDAFSFLFIK